ncbi:MAG: aminotransferase class V-fold PLP-dependent enzyme [Lachnospiraceae bacterium]|nr:aminotransferase class V-fold PLP-dependent enzyme [Lachnospiraceae bacterium]
MIYMDHAATAFHRPQCVADAVLDAMQHMGNAGRGAYAASLEASRVIYDCRVRLARLLGAEGPEQVAFTLNATMSLNLAIGGLFAAGDHIITTQMEHNSVLRPLYRLEQEGAALTILAADRLGRISLEELEHAFRENTRAVVCTHASNLTGNVNDLERIGALCRAHGAYLVVDASQSAGILPIDQARMGIDVLCFTGHKGLLGPQGSGGLCVRKGVSIRPLVVGGSGVQSESRMHPAQMPTALEAGTLNSHGIAGLRAALAWLEEQDTEALRREQQKRMWEFYDGVREIPGVTVYGDFADRACLRAPIVALNIRDWDSGQAADVLAQEYGIMTRAGAHCAPLMHEALGTREQGAVRFSFSHTNTAEEIKRAVCAVRELAGEGQEQKGQADI